MVKKNRETPIRNTTKEILEREGPTTQAEITMDTTRNHSMSRRELETMRSILMKRGVTTEETTTIIPGTRRMPMREMNLKSHTTLNSPLCPKSGERNLTMMITWRESRRLTTKRMS